MNETPKRGIGAHTDDESHEETNPNGSIIALLKRHRSQLNQILAALSGGGAMTDAEFAAHLYTELDIDPSITGMAAMARDVISGEIHPLSGALLGGNLVLQADLFSPVLLAGALTFTNADNQTPNTQQVLGAANWVFDGANYDRMRGNAEDGVLVNPRPTTNTITVTGAANAIATATLPAAGAGLFHYITHIFIKRVATAALAGGALLTVTTTNLNGRAWRTGNQASITVSTFDKAVLTDQEFVHPIKSAVANTNTTIVGPAAGAAVSWHMVIDYFTGP